MKPRERKDLVRLLFMLKGVLLSTSEVLGLEHEPWWMIRDKRWHHTNSDEELKGAYLSTLHFVKEAQTLLASKVASNKGEESEELIRLMRDCNRFLQDWTNNRRLGR